MKRSQMKRKITKLLQSWEGSRLTGKTSEDILRLIEDNGMMPPGREKDKLTFSRLNGEVIGHSYGKYEWDEE